MKKLLLLIILFISSNLYAENLMSYNMWKDKKWNYVITLDDKWEMKMKEANQMGMDNFFIPKGYSLNNAPAGIMVYIGLDYGNIEEFINEDLDNFVKNNKGYQYSQLKRNIKNKYNNSVLLYKMFKKNKSVNQYIGYFSNDSNFYFAIALQLFEENDIYLKDFYTSLEESRILNYKYKIKE